MNIRINSILLLTFITALFCSCGIKNQVQAESKTLDSLTVALNVKIQELKNCDTVLLHKAVDRYNQYASFIKNNINDTLTKNDANFLQQFFNSGTNLTAFQSNRLALLSRGQLIIQQTEHLSTDVKNNAITYDVFMSSFDSERKACIQTIALCDEQINLFKSNIQDLKNSLIPVETLIRSKNNGALPVPVKDSVNL